MACVHRVLKTGSVDALQNPGPRDRNKFNPRDYKNSDFEKDPSVVSFKKWRHDLELFLKTIGTSWKGFTAVMRTSRIYTENFTGDSLREIEALRKKTKPTAPDLVPSFNFY